MYVYGRRETVGDIRGGGRRCHFTVRFHSFEKRVLEKWVREREKERERERERERGASIYTKRDSDKYIETRRQIHRETKIDT